MSSRTSDTAPWCLNARQAFYEGGSRHDDLLGIEDVTERHILNRQMDELLKQKDMLLAEIQHRIANSLQIIAGIILMKGKRGQFKRSAPLFAVHA